MHGQDYPSPSPSRRVAHSARLVLSTSSRYLINPTHLHETLLSYPTNMHQGMSVYYIISIYSIMALPGPTGTSSLKSTPTRSTSIVMRSYNVPRATETSWVSWSEGTVAGSRHDTEHAVRGFAPTMGPKATDWSLSVTPRVTLCSTPR